MHPPDTPCIGVDGAKSGWLAVWRATDGFAFGLYASAAHLVSAHAQAAVIAVDVPIGLSDRDGRPPDALARKFVGGKRASSVFSAPVRGVLHAQSQREASALHREIDGRGFGAQAFGILPKIREWDQLLRADDSARARVREIHPEVSFAAMNDGVGLVAAKKSAEGHALRRQLLCATFDAAAVDSLFGSIPKGFAAPDDVADALAALWSAERIVRGESASLPSPAAVDSTGLGMAIWY